MKLVNKDKKIHLTPWLLKHMKKPTKIQSNIFVISIIYMELLFFANKF